MLILMVCFVSIHLLMIRSEDKVITVYLTEAGSQERSCNVSENFTLVHNKAYTLEVQSEYFIIKGFLVHGNGRNNTKQLEHLNHAKFSVSFEKTKQPDDKTVQTTKYMYSANRIFESRGTKTWTFIFTLLTKYDPWLCLDEDVQDYQQFAQNWTCDTSIENGQSAVKPTVNNNDTSIGSRSNNVPEGTQNWIKITISVMGILLVVQSSYLIYRKAKSRQNLNRNNDEDPISPKSPKAKHGLKPKRDIADRPQLPLPPNEILREETITPGPKRHLPFPPTPPENQTVQNVYDPVCGQIIPKQSYRNGGLDTSDEVIRSPGFPRRHLEGHLVPKQPYRNKVLDNADEGLGRSPGLSRRHMEGPLVPKKSFRNQTLVNSDEDLRSPGFPRRHEGPLEPKQSLRNKTSDSAEELRSPGFVRRQLEGPLVPKKSFRNKVMDNSDEDLRAAGFPRRHEGPLVPKQSLRNKASDSDEELKSPSFVRRQLEAKLAQLPPKAVAASKSFKMPRPLPRSPPSPPPEKAVTFQLPLRQEPGQSVHPKNLPIFPTTVSSRVQDPPPPLHPKKMAVLPPPGPRRAQDPKRMSDEEWEYEALQPTCKYLNDSSYLS